MWVYLAGRLFNLNYVVHLSTTEDGDLLLVIAIPFFDPPDRYSIILPFDEEVHAFWDWLVSIAYKPREHPWHPSPMQPPEP